LFGKSILLPRLILTLGLEIYMHIGQSNLPLSIFFERQFDQNN
jgi:hypothetical protein